MNALFDLDGTLIWALAGLIVAGVVVPYVFAFRRRRRLDRQRLAEARELGIDRPVAQFPFIDPMTCIGCGACARACPEGDVLGVVGGVAVVVNGLRCVGHGRCADACPVGAIEVGLGDLRGRRDVPLLSPDLESTVPGLFVAGELTGLALIRNAIEQGERVANTIADRLAAPAHDADPDLLDLVIVGAGPAGLAAALTAAGRGLRFRVIDQGSGLGGTILQFPARKLVLTRPVSLPGGGALEREEYAKEELLEILGRALAARQVGVRYGEKLERVERDGDQLHVRTATAVHRGRCVLLALGRRGTPRRLGVPGEELPKVLHQLRDADSYRGRRILVVGGGDSAIEAATGLARQPGNRVTLSYRKQGFHRVKRKNQEAIDTMIRRGKVCVAFGSAVESIEAGAVTLRFDDRTERIDNDHVFVLIGGEPPFELLRRCGIAFGGDGDGDDTRRRGGIAAALLLAGLAAAGGPAVAQQSPHGDLAIACDQCHTTAGWEVTRDAPFRHESTGFRLEGMHAVAACAECHREKIFSRVATACSDCHRDPHLGELGLACSDCHDSRRWDPRSEFFSQHARTLFPLLGGHARVDCEACHGGQPPEQFALTPTDCVACHRADFAAATDPPHDGFPTDCRQCHSGVAVNWNAPGFAHTARFPLSGAHAGLACADCHTAGTQARAECASCHRDDYERTRDPNHVAGGFPLTCQTCHGSTSWEPASFDHALSGFPLTGAHASVACADCHSSGYSGTPRDCVSCHRADYQATRDPNHAAAGFPTTCQSCHSTRSWDGASFDHDGQWFPIYSGAHRGTWSSCSTCHVNPSNYRVFECTVCHEHARAEMNDEHSDVANYRYDSGACYACHPDGRD